MTIEYIPVATSSVINNMLENGNITNSPINQIPDSSWLVDGLLYLGKAILGFIGTSGEALEPIFVVVAICGFFLIMAGFDKWGYKLTSGSVIGFISCKILGAVC